MGQQRKLCCFFIDPEMDRKLLFCSVQADHCNTSVFSFVSCCFYFICIYRMSNTDASRPDKMRHMIKAVKSRLWKKSLLFSVEKIRRVAEVPHIVRASCLVQTEIPVMEHSHSVVQISDQLMNKGKYSLRHIIRTKLTVFQTAF